MAPDSLPPAVRVQEAPLDAAALRAAATDPAAGAVVVFEGTARDHHEGQAVADLAYEAYAPMAEAELARLRSEGMGRFGLRRCFIHHRTGVVPLMEAAVVIVTASAHRKEAFEAAAWLMDRIKESVPIWKRERYREGGEAWVEGQARRT